MTEISASNVTSDSNFCLRTSGSNLLYDMVPENFPGFLLRLHFVHLVFNNWYQDLFCGGFLVDFNLSNHMWHAIVSDVPSSSLKQMAHDC